MTSLYIIIYSVVPRVSFKSRVPPAEKNYCSVH